MRLRVLGLTAATLLSAVVTVPVAVLTVAAPVAAAGTTSTFAPLARPIRLLDTREGAGVPLGPAGVATVTATGPELPPPSSVVAVVLNVTVVGPAAVGYWTAYPHGGARPLAANLYVDERAAAFGPTLALPNMVTVRLGSDSMVDIFTQSGGHLVVDMLGYYSPSGANTAGRLAPLANPQRIFDNRTAPSYMLPDTAVTVNVPGGAGAAAAVVSVTTISLGPGFWTVYQTGTPRPPTANLNSMYGLHVVANQVMVSLDASGSFEVYSQSGGFVIVDLVATITGAGAPSSTDGLFVPLDTPSRFLDTRDASLNPLGGTQMPLPGWSVDVPVATNPAINRADVAAVALNVTVTDPLQQGYVSLTPAGSNDPTITTRTTATVTAARAAQTVANHAVVATSARGFEVFTLNGGHVIADVAGYYLGTPAAAPFAKAVNVNTTAAGCLGYPAAPVQEIIVGSSKVAVAKAQQRLLDLGFWMAGADGNYGLTTSQAVMAFQKWKGLPRTTAVDEATAVALNTTLCRPTPTITSGDLVEIDKGRQIMFIIRGGKAQWVVNVSTGGNYFYSSTDKVTGAKIEDYAITPAGDFRVYRVHDTPRYEGSLGTLYRPRFVVGGVAVHGYSSVPNYPASHGCIRVTNAAMDMIWGTNAMPMRSRVVIHD